MSKSIYLLHILAPAFSLHRVPYYSKRLVIHTSDWLDPLCIIQYHLWCSFSFRWICSDYRSRLAHCIMSLFLELQDTDPLAYCYDSYLLHSRGRYQLASCEISASSLRRNCTWHLSEVSHSTQHTLCQICSDADCWSLGSKGSSRAMVISEAYSYISCC